MATHPLPESDDLRRQVRQHLESLRLAGIEWLPAAGTPLAAEASGADEAMAEPDGESADAVPSAPAAPGGLFDEAQAAGAVPSRPAVPVEERRRSLEVLAQEVSGCTRCPELVRSRTRTVVGVGPVGAELCFIGEAPGADEDAQGEPFVGEAGQLLNKIIAACGLRREEVYICNIIKCRPPRNRTPLPQEAANCRGYLDQQLDLVRPRFICALGATAAQNLLQTDQSIGRLRGTFYDYKAIPVVCTYHPAFLLPHRSPAKKREVWQDMKMLLRRMGRPVP